MAAHQSESYFNNPRLLHEPVVRLIARYRVSTYTYVDSPDINLWLTTCGVVYRPDIEKVIERYVDANFSGGWDKANADNEENAMSSTGYVITYKVCPLLWFSKLQTDISFSTT